MISTKKLIYHIISEMTAKEVTTDAFSTLPYTYTNSAIKAHHVVAESSLSNPSAQTSDWTVTTSDGSLVVSGDSINGATTLTLKLVKGA